MSLYYLIIMLERERLALSVKCCQFLQYIAWSPDFVNAPPKLKLVF